MAKFYVPTKLSENIRETPEGFLLCLNVPIARTGWQEYGEGETPLEPGENGLVKIFRDASEVFKPQTIASFEGKAVTIKHPQEFISPDNWSYLAKGTIHNVRKSAEKDEDGEECLLADLLVTDAMAIQLINNKLREVSCGYEAEYEQTGKGEGRQFNIIGNHIALVENGRAGSAYAINDHKREGKIMKSLKALMEQIKLLGKTVDEAVEAEEKKDGKKASDEEKKDEGKKEEKSEDAAAYDELVKAVKDLSAKVEGMAKGGAKDEDAEDADEEKEADKEDGESKDDEAGESEGEMKIEERLKALEAAVAKLLEGKSEEAESSDDDEEMAGMEDSEEEKEESKPEKTGDEARAEILAPGIKVTKGEDIQAKALQSAYKTKEGKEVIDSLTGGKKPVFDSKEKVATLFIAASEIMKMKRGVGLEKTKDGSSFASGEGVAGPVSAEKLNEINAAFWAGKK